MILVVSYWHQMRIIENVKKRNTSNSYFHWESVKKSNARYAFIDDNLLVYLQ